MNSMFYYCESLINLNLSNFNTQNVTNMNYMFSHCKSLTNLNLSNFNTQNVTNMICMFSDCESLTNLNLKKDPNKKYKVKISYIIEDLRHDSDKIEKMNSFELPINLLLMSSQINQINKISCLILLSYINFEKENELYVYYINKKLFKYLQIQKNIDSFIYIRSLYRAAFLLIKEKNFFYARKYIGNAEELSKNSKIDEASSRSLKEIKKSSENGIIEYLNFYMKKFRDEENPDNLTDKTYLKMKKLFKSLNENTYQINHEQDNDNNDNSYLYLISKSWFIKANQFFLDYIKIRDNNIRNNYFNVVQCCFRC